MPYGLKKTSTFEPSEKRLTVSWSQPRKDLRVGHFPQQLVLAAQAKIISHIRNDKYDLYLLSESTLIISDDGFLLITCGQTQLIHAMTYVNQKLGHMTKFVSYSRQRELYPAQQASTFDGDVVKLNSMFEGSNLILNSDFYKYDYFLSKKRETDFFATPSRRTAFLCQPLKANNLERARITIGYDILREAGWQIDHHLFEPWGYSLNAVKGDQYMTLHMSLSGSHLFVTGETNGSFVELEKYWRKSFTDIAARIEFYHNSLGQPIQRHAVAPAIAA